MHLSASQFCHQGTGCHRIGDALLLSLFVGCYQIAQTEGLGCLGTDQFVARNTGVGRKTIFALQDSLSTFDTRNGIAILLADGDIGRDDVLRQEWAHGIMHQHQVVITASHLFQAIDTIVD